MGKLGPFLIVLGVVTCTAWAEPPSTPDLPSIGTKHSSELPESYDALADALRGLGENRRSEALSVEDEAADLCRAAAREESWTVLDLAEFKAFRKKRAEERKQADDLAKQQAVQYFSQAVGDLGQRFPEARRFLSDGKSDLQLPVLDPFTKLVYLHSQRGRLGTNRVLLHNQPFGYFGQPLAPEVMSKMSERLDGLQKKYDEEVEKLVKQSGFDPNDIIKLLDQPDSYYGHYKDIQRYFNAKFEKE